MHPAYWSHQCANESVCRVLRANTAAKREYVRKDVSITQHQRPGRNGDVHSRLPARSNVGATVQMYWLVPHYACASIVAYT
eukprot:6195773-Pleurochrysis_carterae.AAC.3